MPAGTCRPAFAADIGGLILIAAIYLLEGRLVLPSDRNANSCLGNNGMRFGIGLACALLPAATPASLADEIPLDPAQNPPQELPAETGQTLPDELSRQPAQAAMQQEPSGAPAPSCFLNLPQDISIVIQTLGPSVSQDTNVAQLTQQMRAGPKRAGLERYDHALGATDTRVNAKAKVSGQSVQMRDGRWCVKLNHVDVTVTFGIEAHLATELQPGTCPYRAVLQHEEKHVAVAQGLRQSLHDQIETAVVSAIKRSTADANRQMAIKRAEDEVQRFLDDTADAVYAASEVYQMQIDTPQEYDRVHQVCGDKAFGKIMQGQF